MSGQSYTLYGRPGSGSAACEAALKLAGLPHKIVYLDKTETGGLPPEIFKLNPLGQVPVLVLPDGTILTESAAILIHVADLAPEAGLAPPVATPERAAYMRLMVFMAANTYMTDLRFYYPHRYSADENHAAQIKAKSLEEQARNWTALEGMAASGAALLPSGRSTADLYLAMLASWSQQENFAGRWPRLASIATSVASMPELADIWQRNEVVF